MKKYDTEQRLDALLAYFAEHGVRRSVDIRYTPEHLRYSDFKELLSMLEHRGFVEPYTTTFSDGKPTTFYSVYSVTPAGVWFVRHSGFVREAKEKYKEQKRTNFETFKMGWDTVIALVSLGISFAALFIATQ